MTFRIAVVQPIANPIGEDEKNVADAVDFIARAKAEGADFVCFPETYPGPWRMPASFDPTPRMAEAAAKHGINAVYGTIEPLSHNEGTAHNLICMAYGDGRAPVELPPHPSERAVDLYRRQVVGIPIRAGQRVSGVRHRARQGRARHVQRGLYAGGDARAGAARRRADLHAGRHRQGQIVGELAQSDLVARDREPGHRGRPRRICSAMPSAGWPWWRRRRRFCSRAPPPASSRSTSASSARAQCAPARDTVTSSQSYAAKQGVLGPQWQRPELRETMYPRPPQAAERQRRARRLRRAAARAQCESFRANFRTCPLAPISAPNRVLATRKAASSAPPNCAPTLPPWRGWRREPRAGAYVIGGDWIVMKKGAPLNDPLFTLEEARALGAASETVFLGLLDGAARFGYGIAPAAAEALKTRDGFLVTDLRSIAVQGLVEPEHLPPIAEAKAVLHWHVRHRFCPNCGAPTQAVQAGWRRDCPQCKARAFPAHRSGGDHAGDRRRALPARPLARVSCRPCGRAWPASSSRAKSIEDAVRRETREEAGITCGRVVYFHSQPWPFPSSLMIGCHAEALDPRHRGRPRGTRGRALVYQDGGRDHADAQAPATA